MLLTGLSGTLPVLPGPTHSYVRTTIECRMDSMGLELIKYDDMRAFLHGVNAMDGVKAALMAMSICRDISRRLPVAVSVSVGIDQGKVLLLPGDFFGSVHPQE